MFCGYAAVIGPGEDCSADTPPRLAALFLPSAGRRVFPPWAWPGRQPWTSGRRPPPWGRRSPPSCPP
eukprot:883137-Pyramimonas_sp.AAC.1